MESEGIEPSSQACKAHVLPLNYDPKIWPFTIPAERVVKGLDSHRSVTGLFTCVPRRITRTSPRPLVEMCYCEMSFLGLDETAMEAIAGIEPSIFSQCPYCRASS